MRSHSPVAFMFILVDGILLVSVLQRSSRDGCRPASAQSERSQVAFGIMDLNVHQKPLQAFKRTRQQLMLLQFKLGCSWRN